MSILTIFYNRFRCGWISYQKLSNVLLEHTFHSKVKWGLGRMSEDEFSEFLIYLEKNLMGIIRNYNMSMSDFATYFSNSVVCQSRWWKQKQYEKNKRLGYGELLVNEEKSEITEAVTEEILDKVSLAQCEPMPVVSKVDNTEREMLLVLTLKSCYHITDSLVEKIAARINYDVEKLHGMILEARKSMEKKIARIEVLHERSSKAYLQRRNSIACRDFCSEENAARADKVFADYDKRWKRTLESIAKQSMTPSNLVISRLLGISPRRVAKLLKLAESMGDQGSDEASLIEVLN